MSIRRLFEVSLLIATAVVSIATSKSGDAEAVVKYGAATTCSGSNGQTAANTEIEVQYGIIISPSGMDFTDFGLPNMVVRIATDATVTGDAIPGTTRTCTYQWYNNGTEYVHLYSCTNTSGPACNVTFTPL